MSAPVRVGGLVPAVGVVRRLRALAALGWPAELLADRLGEPVRLSENVEVVDAALAGRVRRLYDELSMTPGPSSVARGEATAAGWVPPLAWDEDDLDDPEAAPVPGAVASRDTSALGLVGVFEDFEWCITTGEHPSRAAARCGRTLAAITRAAQRAGRSDLAAPGAREVMHERRASARTETL